MSEPVVIECTLVKAGDDAVLIDTGVGQVWLPRKHCAVEHGMFGATRVTLPDWLAIKKGLRSAPSPDQGSLF
jgi:hypothetical protein